MLLKNKNKILEKLLVIKYENITLKIGIKYIIIKFKKMYNSNNSFNNFKIIWEIYFKYRKNIQIIFTKVYIKNSSFSGSTINIASGVIV